MAHENGIEDGKYRI